MASECSVNAHPSGLGLGFVEPARSRCTAGPATSLVKSASEDHLRNFGTPLLHGHARAHVRRF